MRPRAASPNAKETMKRILSVVAIVLLVAVAALVLLRRDEVKELVRVTARGDVYETGKYLAQAGDCLACHTARGGADYAGGLPIPTPFGTLYTPNITPD